MKELYKGKVQVNKKRKDIKLLVICSEIPHTQIPHHVATSQLNCDKIQITGFHKMRDNRAGNQTPVIKVIKQTPVIEVNKNELK